MNTEKLGFIGVGNMGEALIRGIIDSGLMSPSHIFASDLDLEKLGVLSAETGIVPAENNCDLVEKADVILIAVKPDIVRKVLSEISPCLCEPKWCISIAAGVNTAFIESILQASIPVVRVMPNTPAMVREGMAAICPGKYASKEHVDRTGEIFQAVGKAIVVQEKLMDAVTALSGSGPAFIFLIIESMVDAGIQLGLSRGDATVMAAQTVLGASRLAIASGEHPAVLKNRITSPAGTTADGLYQLERRGVRAAIIDAILAAAERSRQMSSD